MRTLSGCNLLGAIVVYFFLYESSGSSLEAVDTVGSSLAWVFCSLTGVYRCTKTRLASHGTPVSGHHRVIRTAKNLKQGRRRSRRATVCPLRQIGARGRFLIGRTYTHTRLQSRFRIVQLEGRIREFHPCCSIMLPISSPFSSCRSC